MRRDPFLVVFMCLIFLASGLQTSSASHFQSKDISTAQTAVQLSKELAKKETKEPEIKSSNICDRGTRTGVVMGVKNNLKNDFLLARGTYLESGRTIDRGNSIIRPQKQTEWSFGKNSWFSSHTEGLTIWQIGSTSTALIIYFNNQHRGWNSQGVCIRSGVNFPEDDNLSEKFLKDTYNELDSKKPNWGSDCLLLDNTETKVQDWMKEKSGKIGEFSLLVRGTMRKIDRLLSDCWVAGITVDIS